MACGLGLKVVGVEADAPEQKIAVGLQADGAVGEAHQARARRAGRARGIRCGLASSRDRQAAEGGVELEEGEVDKLPLDGRRRRGRGGALRLRACGLGGGRFGAVVACWVMGNLLHSGTLSVGLGRTGGDTGWASGVTRAAAVLDSRDREGVVRLPPNHWLARGSFNRTAT